MGVLDELTVWEVPQETKEWVGEITVTVNGTPVVNFQVQLTLDDVRPASNGWVSPTVLETKNGLMVGVGTGFPLTLNRKHVVWARYTSTPEDVVLRAGVVKAT